MKGIRIFYCVVILFFMVPLLVFSQSINWESPRILVKSGARFVSAVSGGGLIALVWEEFVYAEGGGSGGEIYLSLWTTTDTSVWKKNERFAGPFYFTDKETQIYSLVVDANRDIYLAVISGERRTKLYHSEDGGLNFVSTEIIAGQATVSPRLFLREVGEFFLFITHETKDKLSLYYLLLDRSIFFQQSQYKEYKPFLTEEQLGFNFLPHHCYMRGRDYIVFQASDRGTAYQIFIKISDDRGITWTNAKQLTSFTERRKEKEQAPVDFKNQRPFIKNINNTLYLTWERQFTGEIGQPSQIYYAELREDGGIRTWEQVTNETYSSLYPQIIYYNKHNYLIWFDNPGRDHIRIGNRGKIEWEKKDLSPGIEGDSRFPQPVMIRDFLYIFWETVEEKTSQLYILEPDQSVRPPKVSAQDFSPGRVSKRSSVGVRWTVPEDSSGIASFRYEWTQSPFVRDEDMEEVYRTETAARFEATKDGIWYFHIKAGDLAGNWSETVTISYIRDTTPPGKVTFIPLAKDDRGFLESNTFTIAWNPPKDDDVAGYSYTFEQIRRNLSVSLAALDPADITTPSTSIMLFTTEKSYKNRDNGVWGFSVRAIDKAGNAGEAASFYFILNKYVPVTLVYGVYSRQENNETILRIEGRGYLTGGSVTEIYLDRDGRSPYDYTYSLYEDHYTIVNDGLIDNLKPEIEEKALFWLVLLHKTRGLYTYPFQFELEPGGTIIPRPPESVRIGWQEVATPLLSLSMNEAIVWLIVLFLAIVSITSLTKLAGVVREGQIIQAEVLAIMTGKEPEGKKEIRIRKLRTKGMGLRVKFTLLITSLILIIILMLSITLSYYMIQTQGRNLAENLQKQVKVLMGSLGSGAEKYLPDQNTLELDALVDQSDAMEEALHATITGKSRRGSKAPTDDEYVWATNNGEIDEVIDTAEYQVGESIMTDDVSPLIPRISEQIDKEANEKVGELVNEINELIEDYNVYASRRDQQSIQKSVEIAQAQKEKNNLVISILHNISSAYEGSVPPFEYKNLQNFYTFYKPVVYRRVGEDIFYRGMVKVYVSTENILKAIEESRNELILRIIVISLIAIGLGIAGAILLASITILPIKKLARGVAVIRDTEDKTMLKDHIIDIRQKDEIRMLAETINQMTQGLVKAAIANKDLIVGKEVQKMFIPLEKDESGRKGSTGEDMNNFVELFGYYEGAKGVSGDYFDFIKVDNEHYAVIKCDVAGKGVPAALIMVEVATIFIDYFHHWTPDTSEINTEQIVYKINDLVEERGFKGRFAALIIVIIDIKKGIAYCCNAGDNILHMYSSAEDRMIQKQLPQAPAAGVFPSDLVRLQSSFKQVPVKLQAGDALFLFSDGFDEAKRLFRNENFEPVKCAEPSIKDGDVHLGTHSKGDDGEEFGIERLYGIIDAVIHGKSYKLVKHHNPVPNEELTFNFSNLNGSMKNIIMSLVCVEKMYRVYKNPKATADDRILVDKKVDEFLQEHFVQYGEYFQHRMEMPENPSYMAFTHMNEDEQFDDLTILGILKK